MAIEPETKRSTKISVTLTPEERERLGRRSKEEDRTISQIAQHAIREYLERRGC